MEAGLKDKLNSDLKQALREGAKVKVSVIRLVLSAVNYAEMARQKKLEDADVIGVISKEARQREESIAAFKQGNRSDLVAKEEAELEVLKTYLPEPASREDIIAEVKKVIAEVGAAGPRDKGKVMPKVIANLKGRADGREINEVVTELLK